MRGHGHFTKPVKVSQRSSQRVNKGPRPVPKAPKLKQSRLNTAYGITKRKG